MLQSIFSFNASSSIASISWNKSGLAPRKARLFLGGEEKRLERNRPPQNVKVAQTSRRQFGPIFEAGQQGLLNFLLSVTRPNSGGSLAKVWVAQWQCWQNKSAKRNSNHSPTFSCRVAHQGLLTFLLRVSRSPLCHRFEEVRFWGAIPHLGWAGLSARRLSHRGV